MVSWWLAGGWLVVGWFYRPLLGTGPPGWRTFAQMSFNQAVPCHIWASTGPALARDRLVGGLLPKSPSTGRSRATSGLVGGWFEGWLVVGGWFEGWFKVGLRLVGGWLVAGWLVG